MFSGHYDKVLTKLWHPKWYRKVWLTDWLTQWPQPAISRVAFATIKKTFSSLDSMTVQEGVGYNPGDWIDYDVTSSALDCQTHCRAHSECRLFTFYTDTHKCYMKSGQYCTILYNTVQYCYTLRHKASKPTKIRRKVSLRLLLYCFQVNKRFRWSLKSWRCR